MVELIYEGSNGEKINLMGSGVYAQNPEVLAGNRWSYTTQSIEDIGMIESFSKDVTEQSLLLSIMHMDRNSFNYSMERMHKCFDRDIRRKEPGKLWWNGFYKKVFIIDSSYTEFEEEFDSIEKTVVVASATPYWTKERNIRLRPSASDEGRMDYPVDYGFDYDIGIAMVSERNECIWDCDFRICFFGPFDNPEMSVNGHVYRVYESLSDGDRIIINSRDKTIKKIDSYGNETNVFHSRDRESYIFEKIPEGPLSIDKPHSLDAELTLLDERGEPVWI